MIKVFEVNYDDIQKPCDNITGFLEYKQDLMGLRFYYSIGDGE